MKNNSIVIGIILLSSLLVSNANAGGKIRLDLIQLPKGFTIELYGEVDNARSMVLSPKGTLFVGTRRGGNVYALVDENKDNRADKVYTIVKDLNMPIGVTFKDDALYVAEVHRVLRFDQIEDDLSSPPKPVVVNDSFFNDPWHGWKIVRFGPDGKLYVPVGAPCNTCLTDDKPYGKIMRMDQDGSNLETIAYGVRNSVGFDWHPQTDELWFTDNGRDMMGDDIPPDELNHLRETGQHFGFPYCHGTDILDPEFGKNKTCDDYTPPAQELGPHVASLGMRFYTGDMFPSEYKNQIFIAEHGSWNRSKKIGYRVTLVEIEDNKAISYKEFATGWKQGEDVWGRPVDILNMPDGSLLVSDDYAGAIYRITYDE